MPTSPNLDLVVRNARIATASDCFDGDIGVHQGRVVQLGASLPIGVREIDARGRVVTPGGVDAHCHLDQPMPAPVRMADDFDTGTRSAACGGTTTVIPFAAQHKGQSLREAVDDYHRRADVVAQGRTSKRHIGQRLIEQRRVRYGSRHRAMFANATRGVMHAA